jgi:hypothetical protein
VVFSLPRVAGLQVCMDSDHLSAFVRQMRLSELPSRGSHCGLHHLRCGKSQQARPAVPPDHRKVQRVGRGLPTPVLSARLNQQRRPVGGHTGVGGHYSLLQQVLRPLCREEARTAVLGPLLLHARGLATGHGSQRASLLLQQGIRREDVQPSLIHASSACSGIRQKGRASSGRGTARVSRVAILEVVSAQPPHTRRFRIHTHTHTHSIHECTHPFTVMQ